METFVQNIYLTKREKLSCSYCKKPVRFGDMYVAETENHRGTCFTCSPFVKTTFLEPGNAALTRRSKKHSSVCGILFQWNKRRRRFERKGQYVEAKAIELAQKECEADAQKRALNNEKAAIKRAANDKIYIAEFSKAIRKLYPSCPKNREVAIAKHACEKYSGRVGRSANAKKSILLYRPLLDQFGKTDRKYIQGNKLPFSMHATSAPFSHRVGGFGEL